MLILLEGTDRSGKTTLAQAIRARIEELYPNDQIQMLHAGPPQQHPVHEYITPLIHYAPGNQHHVICDRWHIGETVYPSVCQRSTQLTTSLYQEIETFLRSRGALLVHVHAHPDVLLQRLHDENSYAPGQSYITPEQLVHVYEQFMIEVHRSTLFKCQVNTTMPRTYDATVNAQFLVASAKAAENAALNMLTNMYI